ncbi:MAG: cob(I)yrinic acid a,c-diamide adenosyltransferase [Bacteroidetes bacterium]|jgi:cob(I)alamin adenosyltransferase|nr:cob(I)yrinic acid a,c-diamide adenosyltransferase [Bacteroidota bacterium]
MKIYTKKGDDGHTSLFGGTGVTKNNLRIHTYGTVDEINSVIGMVLTHPLTKAGERILTELQNQLFVLGADLATLPEKKAVIDRVDEKMVAKLEAWIDELDEQLPALTSFILPGGCQASAALNLARTVCRRAERYAVSLKQEESISPIILKYLNRLSDLLFVLARFENKHAGVEETKWVSRK